MKKILVFGQGAIATALNQKYSWSTVSRSACDITSDADVKKADNIFLTLY